MLDKKFSVDKKYMSISYIVNRTRNRELPIYKKFRSEGRQINTVVRQIQGDYLSLRKDLAAICEAPVRVHIGSLEVKGVHTWKIKEFLESKGF